MEVLIWFLMKSKRLLNVPVGVGLRGRAAVDLEGAGSGCVAVVLVDAERPVAGAAAASTLHVLDGPLRTAHICQDLLQHRVDVRDSLRGHH